MSNGRLPSDAVHGVSSLIFTVFWHCFIGGFFVFIISLILVRRETFVDVARTDRVVMAYDAFPVTSAPWGYFLANREVTVSRFSLGITSSAEEDPLMGAFRKQTSFFQSALDKLTAYWTLIWPRFVILLFFLPGLFAIIWMAWGMGYYLNARHVLKGLPLDSFNYRNWKMALGLSYALLFSYPFWPWPLSSWLLLVPMIGVVLCTVYVRRWRA